MKKEKIHLDPKIEQYYLLGQEKDRLNQGVWQLERDRTFRILGKSLPKPPAVIYDVGGAAGAYAFPLAEQGYEMHLIDPVSLHVEQAQARSKATHIKLASCTIGDARQINKPDASADAVLFFGPLYHLVDKKDRMLALKEAFRVLKPKGVLLAASISRFSSFMDGIHDGVFTDKEFCKIVQEDLSTGHHKGEITKYFTTAYLHHPDEFKKEIKESGFKDVTLMGVEGPVWHGPSLETLKDDPKVWQQLLDFIEQIESEPTIIGASAHIIARAIR